MTLLSAVFLLEELAPWHDNRMKRLVKTPKLHLKRFVGGVVVYDGETSVGFGDGLYAIPLRTLWEGT